MTDSLFSIPSDFSQTIQNAQSVYEAASPDGATQPQNPNDAGEFVYTVEITQTDAPTLGNFLLSGLAALALPAVNDSDGNAIPYQLQFHWAAPATGAPILLSDVINQLGTDLTGFVNAIPVDFTNLKTLLSDSVDSPQIQNSPIANIAIDEFTCSINDQKAWSFEIIFSFPGWKLSDQVTVNFQVALYHDLQITSLTLNGSTASTVPLGSLMQELLSTITTDLTLPDALTSLTLSNIDVELNLARQVFTYNTLDQNNQPVSTTSSYNSYGTSLNFTLGSTSGSWVLVPGLLSLQPAAIRVTLGDGTAQAEIRDTFTLAGVLWELYVHLPSLRGQLQMADNADYSLGALLSQLKIPVNGLSDLSLIAASILFDADAQVAMVHLELQDLILDATDSISDISLDLAYQNNAFTGSLQASGSVSIGALLVKIAPFSVEMPAAINALIVTSLSASYSSAGDITFSCGGDLTVDGVTFQAVIQVSHNNNNGTSDTSFSGTLNMGDNSLALTIDQTPGNTKFSAAGDLDFNGATVQAVITFDGSAKSGSQVSGTISFDNLTFNLIFDRTLNSKSFIADYYDASGQSVNLKDLVTYFVPGAANEFPSLPITLKQALLAYQSGSASSKWLMGVDVDLDIKLADLHLPALPMVSADMFPANLPDFDFQFLIADQQFSASEIQALSGVLPPASQSLLPVRDISGIVLNTSFSQTADTQPAQPISSSSASSPASAASPASSNAQNQPLAQNDGTQWIKLQKNFGPLYIEQVGIRYHGGQLTALLDAALTTGGLTIDLQGLQATSPLSPLSPTFGLDGLGLQYQNGDIEIAGAFLKSGGQYAGLALLRTSSLTLSAIGAYGKDASGDASLFLYATLNYPLGGPAFFFVTGLAAGFGYNRSLIVPTIDQVANFPLVAEAVSGPPAMPADASGQQTLLANELAGLLNYVPMDAGQMFIAVGIKFTSFKMIESFALLIVQFGNRTEIDLLGLSTLIVPTPQEGDTTPALAEAQLALKATFIPEEGFLGVQAQLTAASYIIDRNCHLVGGFAFYSWLSGPHAGDFVLTLGGYHPKFKVPSHYPTVPRLGLNWQLNPDLSMTGQMYYALTAHALMAGGSLSIDYQHGAVHAWCTAGTDFLLTWQPYHYEADLYINLGAEVTVHFFGTHHLSFEAGADLNLWGPPFGGHADIHLKVCGIKVSFDISFGSSNVGARPIAWDAFKAAFLPADDQVCSMAISQGLVRSIQETSSERWIVNPQSFAIVTNSVIPVQSATAGAYSSPSSGSQIAVQPMGVTSAQFNSTVAISITFDGKNCEGDFSYQPILKNVPAGMWGAPQLDGNGFLQQPELNPASSFVENALCGLTISPNPIQPSSETCALDSTQFNYESTNHADTFFQPVTQPTFTTGDWKNISLADNQSRNALLQELGFGNATMNFDQPLGLYSLSAPQVAASIQNAGTSS